MKDLFPNAIDSLRESLINNIEKKNIELIVHCLTAAKVSTNDFEKIFLNSNLDPYLSANCLIAVIQTRLSNDEFKNLTTGRSNQGYLLEQFEIGKKVYFHLIEMLISFYEANCKIIAEYSAVLFSKRTRSIKKDKWNDVDESGWQDVLREFTDEKLTGNTFATAFDALPAEVKLFLELKNSLDLFPRFVWTILELNKEKFVLLSQPESVRSSKEIGTDFEYEIKRLIEEANPKAVVETTPSSGDQGADLIVYIGPMKLVIQAKKYSGSVGNSAVQEVYSAQKYLSAHAALVVTNSDYTKSARELASELEVGLLYEHQVFDFFSRF